jgi:hypothetical protein
MAEQPDPNQTLDEPDAPVRTLWADVADQLQKVQDKTK